MDTKFDTPNDLTFKVSNTNNQILVDENCCTLLAISLNSDGDIYTTFLGAYNKEILKLLSKTQKKYYKTLMKKLKSLQHENTPEEVIKKSSKLENNKTDKNNTTKTKKQTKIKNDATSTNKGENANEKK